MSNSNQNPQTESSESNSLGILTIRNTNKAVKDSAGNTKKEYNPVTKQHDKIVFSDEDSNNIVITFTESSELASLKSLSVKALKTLHKLNDKLQITPDKAYHQASSSDVRDIKHNGETHKGFSIIFKPARDYIDYTNVSLADLSA